MPLLVGTHIYSAGDTLGFNYPALKALQPFSINSLLSDPLSGRGFPWLVTYGTLSPIAHTLRLVFNEYQTLAWLVYIYFSLGAFFMALFLKRSGRSDAAAFIGGLVYVCAFFSIGDGDYPLASSLPIFSALLLVLQSAQKKFVLNTILISLIISYGWLSGHFNFVPLILCASGVYALWKFSNGDRKSIYSLFIGAFVGGAVGMIKLIPALAYVQLSERAGGISVADAASHGSLHLSALYTAILPYLRLPVLGGNAGEFFIGALPLALLFVGLISKDKKIRFAVYAWATTILIAVPHSPLYWIIQHIPLLSYLRGPTRWLLVGYAPLAFIVAWTVDAVISGKFEKQRSRVARIAFYIGAAALTCSFIFAFIDIFASEKILSAAKEYFNANLYAKTSGLPLEHYHNYIDRTWNGLVTMFSLLSLRYLVPLLGIIFTGWYLSRKKIEAQKLIILTIFTSFIPFFLYHGKESVKSVEKVAAMYEGVDADSGYIMPILPGLSHFMESTKHGDVQDESLSYSLGLLKPNMHSLLGVKSSDFYQPIQSRRMAMLLASIGSGNAPVPYIENLSDPSFSPEERMEIIKSRYQLFAAMNVSKVVSIWDLPEPFVLNSEIKPVDRLSPIHIYDVPNVRPVVYYPKKIKIISANEDEAIDFMQSLDDKDLSLIECDKCSDIQGGEVDIDVITDEDLLLELDVDAKLSSWIVVSRPRIPGWRVEIDGEEVETYFANGMFFGIPVKAGDHRISMRMSYKTLLSDSLEILVGEDGL